MSLAQSLNSQPVERETVLSWARKVANKIRLHATPEKIILFGSAAEGRFRNGSDLDLLLVFSDIAALRQGRLAMRLARPFEVPCPIDFVFVTRTRFDEQKDCGGICFVANHEGIPL
jgi:predicted nucleotidyltransferase